MKDFSIILPKSSQIPCEKSKMYYTMKENQAAVTFPIYQGESKQIAENHWLGRFSLADLEPRPAKEKDRFEVRFEVDKNGIMHLSAKDKFGKDGAETKVTIKSDKGCLTQEQIDE